jgi:hypothetical protein
MGSKVVPSGQPLQLRVRTSGLDDGEQATFEIFRKDTNEQLTTVNGKVVDGFATGEWTPEGPAEDDDLQEWELYFKVKCAGLETQSAPLLVYTDWAEVKCVDAEGNPKAEVPLVIQVSETKRPGDTDGGGLFKAEELPHGAVQVQFEEPYELIEWVSEDGPKLEAKVRKALPGKLIWPEAGQHQQYVNLDEDGEAPEQGHTITIKATLEDGKAGDLIYFKVEWGEENSQRSDPKPEVVGGAEEDWCPQGGKQLSLPGDEGEVEVQVELGLAGGDVVHVFVSGTEEFKKAKTQVVTITNWRRLYYQITRMETSPVPNLGPAMKALAEVFVEYELTEEVTVSEDDALPDGSLLKGREVGELGVSGTMLNIGEHDVEWWQGKFKGAKSPLEAHLILADCLYDCGPGGEPIEQTVEALAEYGRKTLSLADGETYTVFSRSLIDGDSSVRPGSYWESAAPEGHPDHGKRGDITPSQAEFGSLYGDKVQITLPDEAKAIVGEIREAMRSDPLDPETKHPVKVVVNLHVARGPYGGMTDGLHQVLTTSGDESYFNGVLVHELGHAIKMCLAETPPGLSADDHGRQYTGRGHQGEHCAHGINEETWANGQDFRAGDGYCVMWGSSYDGGSNPVGYCSRCLPFTKAQGMLELKQGD